MKSHVTFGVAVGALVAALVAPGCQPAGPDGPSATVEVGALLPLSGSEAPVGLQQRRAFELAEERINAAGGTRVKFIFVDTQSDAEVGQAGAREVIEKQGLPVVFAFPCAVVYKAQPIADRAGSLLMACNMDPETARASPRTFRVFPQLREQTQAMLKHLGNGDGKRAAVIRLDAPAPNNAVTRLLVPGLEAQGWKVAANAIYSKAERDYEAIGAKVKAATPDAIVMYVDAKAVGPLLKLLRREGVSREARILGGISFAFASKLPAEVLEGVVVVAPACAASERGRVQASLLGREFRKRYGRPPHVFAAFCFDGAMLIGDALKHTGGRAAGVQAYLTNVTDYAGVTGPIAFDEAGDAAVKWDVCVYRSGKLVRAVASK